MIGEVGHCSILKGHEEGPYLESRVPIFLGTRDRVMVSVVGCVVAPIFLRFRGVFSRLPVVSRPSSGRSRPIALVHALDAPLVVPDGEPLLAEQPVCAQLHGVALTSAGLLVDPVAGAVSFCFVKCKEIYLPVLSSYPPQA